MTATGPLSIPFAAMADLLAASSTFRTLVNAADATAALAFIKYPEWDFDRHSFPSPGAVLCDEDGFPHFKERMGSQGGQLLLMLYGPTSEHYPDDLPAENIDWRNTCGAILEEMLTLAKTPGPAGKFYWSMTRWEKAIAPGVLDETQTGQERTRVAGFILHWV